MASMLERRKAAGASFGATNGAASTLEAIEAQYESFHEFVLSLVDVLQEELFPVDFLLFLCVFFSLTGEAQARFYDRWQTAHYVWHPFEVDMLMTSKKDDLRSKLFGDQAFKVRISKPAKELLIDFLTNRPQLLSLLNRHLNFDSQYSNTLIAPSNGRAALIADADRLTVVENGVQDIAYQSRKAQDAIKWGVSKRFRNFFLGSFSSANDIMNKFNPESEPSPETPFYKNYVDRLLPPIPLSTGAPVDSAPSAKRSKPDEDSWPSIAMMSFSDANDLLTCVASSARDGGKCIVAGFEDSTARVYRHHGDNDQFGQKSHILVGHSQPVYGAAVYDGRVVTCSGDGQARLWTSTDVLGGSYRNVKTYGAYHGSPLFACAFAPFGHLFATGGRGGIVKLWSSEYSDPLRGFSGHLGDVESVAFHPNAHYIISGSTDKTVRLWDVQSPKVTKVFTGLTSSVETVACDPTGRFIAAGGSDSLIAVFDISTGKRLRVIDLQQQPQQKSLPDPVMSLSWSQDGSYLAAAVKNGVTMFPMSSWTYNGDDHASADLLFRSFKSRCDSVVHVNFLRPDVLLAAGISDCT